MTLPSILCVDDESRVLDGLRRVLHGRFEVAMSGSGAEALARLDRGERFQVVVSDMRMPAMNGAELLAEFRRRCPDTARILLTGHSDLESAIAAVNEGQIFRFLTKPSEPQALIAALSAGVEQHRLITAERELLEKTLVGSVRAMTDVLALAHPSAFGSVVRQHTLARKLAERMSLEDAWHVEVASMLGSLGFVVLPEELLSRLFRGQPLSNAEQAMLAQLPAIADSVIAKIPRLEKVAAVLRHQSSWLGKAPVEAGSARGLPLPAAILRIVHDLGIAEELTGSLRDGVAQLRGHAELYDAALLDTLGEVCNVPPIRVLKLPLSELRSGMVLVEDVLLDSGMLLVARGHRVTEHLLLRLVNNYARRLREPLVCEVT